MILHGDCLELLKTLDAESVDAVVTDPPYGLEFMGKEWDGADGFRRSLNAADVERENVFGRTSARAPEYRALETFQRWCEAWARECLRVLKPGGHLVAFGGTRTYHRLACAIEDAGFEIRDALDWIYGTGFPKSLNVSKGIDAAAGAEREVVGKTGRCVGPSQAGANGIGTFKEANWKNSDDKTAPATDAAKQWDGWGTALKPAHEPIVLARKPLIGTVVANVLKHGTGALNVDACRVDGGKDVPGGRARTAPQGSAYGDLSKQTGDTSGWDANVGRWPPNILLTHAPECVESGVCAEGCPVAEMDRQSGALTSGTGAIAQESGPGYKAACFGAHTRAVGTPMVEYGDTGGASRFFPIFRYCAKADREERERGCEGLAGRQRDDSRIEGNPGGDNPRNRGVQKRGNHHPTVKPVALMRWLVRLVTPPGGLVLDPFLGSGTTAVACKIEGMQWIGCEREAEYIAIAEARVAAAERPALLDVFDAVAADDATQAGLFE
jgi:site-specific DNA-methyltransferase (adenine-specific)